jgi:23S rRNA pseudouridine1911/1915/1917 synthase
MDKILENDDFIAINKPSGLLSIPDRQGKENSLKKLLEEKYGKIFTVHRLDRDTSGVIIFAKNENAHRHLSIQFESHAAVKIYHGLVIGSPAEKTSTIELPIMEHPVKKGLMVINRKGKISITDYEVVEVLGKYSWMKFRIHTGRTHQIRVHMKDLGHPIVCDELYGDGAPILVSSLKTRYKLSLNEEAERPILGRLALHSSSLSFTDQSRNTITLEAPLPKDLTATLKQLRKYS